MHDLGLDNVKLIRARAELRSDMVIADVVTARAVTGLRIWPADSAAPGRQRRADRDQGTQRRARKSRRQASIRKLGSPDPVVELGEGLLEEPSTVVRML